MSTRGVLKNFAPALHVEAITDFGAFLDLGKVWDRLVDEAGIDYPFLTYDWVRTWWECFGKGKQLHILVIKDGNEPVALIPLMYSFAWIYGLKVRQLEFIYNSHTPRFDFVIPPYRVDIYRVLWDYLSEIGATWDVVKLPQLNQESQTLRAMEKLAREDEFLVGSWPSTESPYLKVTGTWDDYFGGLDRKYRSNIRNRLNRLHKAGNVEVEVVTAGAGIARALDAGLEIEAKAWKGRAGTAILCHPDSHAFYLKMALRAAEHGWLRLNFLNVNGRKIAFDYSLLYKNKLYMLKPGYDPEFAALSPYNSLCCMLLQSAFDSGLSEYDFLGTKDDWKLNWTGATRPHCWLFIYSNRLRPALVHYAKFRLSPLLKRHRLFRMLWDSGLRTFDSEYS